MIFSAIFAISSLGLSHTAVAHTSTADHATTGDDLFHVRDGSTTLKTVNATVGQVTIIRVLHNDLSASLGFSSGTSSCGNRNSLEALPSAVLGAFTGAHAGLAKITWTPPPASQGTDYLVCVDAGGAISRLTIRVANVAPTANSPTLTALELTAGGETGSRQAMFTDQGDTNALRYTVKSSDSAVASATVDATTGLVTVTPEMASENPVTITVTAHDRAAGESGGLTATQTFEVTVNAAPVPPAADSGGGSGGAIAAILIGAGTYYWWKKRQIQNGNAAKMALLPEVSFDLDRSNRRAFYTRMNWQNSGHSNWQIRSNLALHTKYSGELLDWNADSHLGYRLKGKFGEFNPYLRGKFVQNDPENAEMRKTYSLGLNFALPNRFAIQIAQPDSEISRFSVNTQWHLPKNISLQLNQPNSDLENYAFGISWRKSKIRYGISGETSSNTYRLSGEFWF